MTSPWDPDPAFVPLGSLWVAFCLAIYVLSIAIPHDCEHPDCPHDSADERTRKGGRP